MASRNILRHFTFHDPAAHSRWDLSARSAATDITLQVPKPISLLSAISRRKVLQRRYILSSGHYDTASQRAARSSIHGFTLLPFSKGGSISIDFRGLDEGVIEACCRHTPYSRNLIEYRSMPQNFSPRD
jgi:hypothetical protein